MHTTTISFHQPQPPLSTTLTCTPDPQQDFVADHTLGTLTPEPTPTSVPIRGGLHFTPAWSEADEARVRITFLGFTPEQALREARTDVMRAARRRALCGVTWHVQRITCRVTNAAGEDLACRTIGGISSDLSGGARAQLEGDLTSEALAEARDWAILGLN
ncbi:hypothetical protein IHN32_04030 [Deinococcus sp. 14RED07]|uniref:hypothetical protein n=1 Tax=unclassified Deinococcus TaxID=2623546 RepID=UPI001E31B1BB|nr:MULTISPECIES: hypothetical protein [unclassified Deinococcus]MCD0160705.1 hypothetical protein [Deinococcus sp. 6YEL10]MCD0166138.1 hypothetical protein [Deinococcus sp. 12RED42]MCD0175119.1 hypothetical protein [Deinococcus sp. 14RED07]